MSYCAELSSESTRVRRNESFIAVKSWVRKFYKTALIKCKPIFFHSSKKATFNTN
jgi:hypothetical protein